MKNADTVSVGVHSYAVVVARMLHSLAYQNKDMSDGDKEVVVQAITEVAEQMDKLLGGKDGK